MSDEDKEVQDILDDIVSKVRKIPVIGLEVLDRLREAALASVLAGDTSQTIAICDAGLEVCDIFTKHSTKHFGLSYSGLRETSVIITRLKRACEEELERQDPCRN